MHVLMRLDSAEQIAAIRKAIPKILPWCMTQHFAARVWAQATLRRLWKFCETSQNSDLRALTKEFLMLENAIKFDFETKYEIFFYGNV